MRSENLRRTVATRLGSWAGAFSCCLGVLLLEAQVGVAPAALIQPDRRIDWIPGVTVGVQGGIPTRTNLIDVTTAPYNADNTGVTDATAAIQSAINAAVSGSVVYLPTGKYRISSSLSFDKSNVTLRGDGPTNSILLGLTASMCVLKVGHDGPGAGDSWAISSATKGSSSIVLSSANSIANGYAVTPGNIYKVSELNSGSDTFPVIDVYGYERVLYQAVSVVSVVGNTVNLSAPLAWSFTNAPQLTELDYSGIPSLTSRQGIGLESFGITLKNGPESGATGFEIVAEQLANCWFTNMDLGYANGYQVSMANCVNCTLSGLRIHDVLSSGTSHSGLILSGVGSSLIENNIFSDGLGPAVEFFGSAVGCAFFGNFFTNNLADFVNHSDHPMMDLWEGNVFTGSFEVDGYFGSGSHQTLFRNTVGSTYCPLLFKRWTAYVQVIGNVLGSAGASYPAYSSEVNGAGNMIMQLGFPNIGNNNYNGTSTPPLPWNYPGDTYVDLQTGATVPNGIFTFTNTQVNTTNLIGIFTNIPAPYGITAIKFRDGVNTNLYYPVNGVPVRQYAGGTSSNLFLTAPITVSNGWTVFFIHPGTYQQLQQNDKYTHTITGNYDYFTKMVTWDTNGIQILPVSLLYTNGAPSWWGTNRWPAINPLGSPLGAPIPAQLRYLGLSSGTNTTTQLSAPSGLHVIGVVGS